MKVLPPISRRAYAVGGTILTLFALFGYYFWGYLPQQEEKLTAQGVRALQQISNNFTEKYKSFQKNGESIIKSRVPGFTHFLMLEKELRNNPTNNILKKDYENLFQRLRSSIQIDETNKNLKLLRYDEDPLPNELGFRITPDFTNESKTPITGNIRFSSVLSSFFLPLQRDDSFIDYLIFQGTTLVYCSTPNEVIQIPERYSNKEVDKTDDNPYDIIPIDSAVSHYFPSGLEIILASKKYKLFSTKFETTNGKKWSIYGLEDAKSFQEEAKRFPYLIIVFGSLALLFVFFALPLLKLSFMSGLERLHIRDVVLTSTSFIFCIALLIIAFLTVFTYYGIDKNEIDGHLKTLSTTIEDEFRKEIIQINALLNSIEKKVVGDTISFTRYVFTTDESSYNATRISAFHDADFLIESLNLYPFFTNTYWVDQDGFQQFQFSTATDDHRLVEKINLQDRNYFKAIKNKMGWRDKELIGEPFFIESLFSRITGERMAVVAKASKAKKLVWQEDKKRIFEKEAAMIGVATKLYSVIDPVLPPGYAFSIIDPVGNVVFHSDKSKNLQENYLKESDQVSNIVSAMHSNGENHADINYNNRDHRIFIRHMRNFPWYLIVSYDKSFIQSPYLNISSITVSGVLLIGFVGILMSFLVALTYRRSSKLKSQRFPFYWIWPYREKRNKFFRLGWFNLMVAVALVWYNGFLGKTIIETFGSFCYALIISYIVCFAVLAKEEETEVKDVRYRNVLLFSNILTLSITLFVVGLTGEYFTFFVLWVFVLSTTIYFSYNTSNHPKEKQEKGVATLKTAGLNTDIFSSGNKKQNTEENSTTSPFTLSFVWMVFTYLIITSVLPSFYMFRKIYDQEKLIQKRHALFEISAKLEGRNWEIKQAHKDNGIPNSIENKISHNTIYDAAKEKGLYFLNLGYDECKCSNLHKTDPSIFDGFLYDFRPYFNDIFKENSGFVFPSSSDASWISKKCPTHDMVMEYQRTKYPNEEVPIILASQVPGLFSEIELFENSALTKAFEAFKGFKISEGLDQLGQQPKIVFRGFFLLFILTMTGLFFFSIWKYLGFTIKRIFGLNLYENLEIIGVDDKYLRDFTIENIKSTDDISADNEEDYLNIFIVSSPFSSTKDILKNQKFKPISLSEILNKTHYEKNILQKATTYKDDIVVIEEFGYGIDNVTAGWRTLEVIEKLQTNRNKIIIISKLSPTQVIEKYESLNAKETNKHEHLDVFISKWKDVLAEFIEMYFSYVVSNGQLNTRKKLPEHATINKMLAHEIGVHEPYFHQLYGSIYVKSENGIELTKTLSNKFKKLTSLEKKEIFKEEILLKIQTMAHPFYYSLWNACSKDERFFLYDLATDGFANIKNTSVIIKLLEKGLIFYDESLHIMNESFRNFILSIDKAEALEMEKELNRSGNWRVYQAVIILAVISLVFFFIFANESIVKQFSALLAGLAATIPYILRLGGFFSPGSDTVKA